jgi:1,4-dihydroxy-2-naphthoyl-CoA hydrolase
LRGRGTLYWTGGAREAAAREAARGEREVRVEQETLDAIMARTAAQDTLAGRMGITIVSASASRVVATMPVQGNTQPQGLLHGGASCVLAETVGSLGAFLHAGPGRAVVGIEISATHHRGVRDGEVTAVATLAHGGRTLASYDIVVTDTGGHRVCTSRLTCLIRDQAPGIDLNGADKLDKQ